MERTVAGSKLLVGIDFSDACERALLHAVALAEREQAQLELVHVFEWEDPDPADGAARAELRLLTAAARRRLAALCSSLVGDRVPAEIQVRIGDPALELRREAERSSASLLVLGARGRRRPAQGAVGRTVDRICRSSPVPVLLIAPGAAAGEEQVLLRSAHGQLRWDASALGSVRHPVAAGCFLSAPHEAATPLSL